MKGEPETTGPSTDWFDQEDDLLSAAQNAWSTDDQPAAPELVGYHNLQPIARGGQGNVYRGVRDSDGAAVAIKVLRDDRSADPADRQRFEHEIRIASTLEHPKIVHVIDHGRTATGRRYLIMPFVDGASFDIWAAFRRDTEGGLRQIAIAAAEVADAIDFAHRHGVLHRDLKPSNIMVSPERGACVLDFGLAGHAADHHWNDGSAQFTVTESGMLIGSLAYMSPEQAAGVDAETGSDVYALGVVLYLALTGEMPYCVNASLRDVLNSIVSVQPVPPSRRRPLPADLETIVLTALEKSPSDRYSSAGALADDLRCFANDESIAARRSNALRRLQRKVHRYRVAAVASVVTLAVVAVLALFAIGARADARAALHTAQRERDDTQAAMRFVAATVQAFDPAQAGGAVRIDDVLVQTAQRIQYELAGSPRVQAMAAHELGHALVDLAQYEHATVLLAIAEQARRETLRTARTPQEIADAQRELSLTLLLQGLAAHGRWQLAEAEEKFRLALEFRPDGPGLDRQERAGILVHLARVQGAMGENEAAAATLRECRAVLDLEPEAYLIAVQYHDAHGRVSVALRQFEVADQAFAAARELVDRYSLPHDPVYFGVLQGLASCRVERGMNEDALHYARAAIAGLSQMFGPEHGTIGVCEMTIARAMWYTGDPAGAVSHADTAVRILSAAYGPDNGLLISPLSKQGRLKHTLGDFSGAEVAFARAVSIQQKNLPTGAARDDALNFMARIEIERVLVLLQLDRTEEARAAFLPAVERLSPERLPPDDPIQRQIQTCRQLLGEAS